MYDFLVIGKGLIGAAAARYLSAHSSATAVIGPDEPQDWSSHSGVFASHYDQGRITRQLAPDPVWAALAQRSIAQYHEIEARSGVNFYMPGPVLYVAPQQRIDVQLAPLTAAAKQNNLPVKLLSAAEITAVYPELQFPLDSVALLEPPPAGAINPRALIQAQLAIAARQGAAILRETVTRVEPAAAGVVVHSANGGVYRAQRVLVAAGAFSNCFDLLPRPLDLRIKTETIILAELSPGEAARLKKMPVIIYDITSPVLTGIYLLPPLRYPNGRIYLKMGCDTTADQWPAALEAMRAWMIAGDSDVLLPAMRTALQNMLPGLSARAYKTSRCLVTYTRHRRPYIDAIIPDQLVVAAGGNGSGAKSSDAIGKLAADLMVNGRWTDELDAANFTAR